jgi:hypothetical protein
MLRPTGLIGATAAAAFCNGGDIGMFVGGCRIEAGSVPHLQDWIMPYLPEIATVYHRCPQESGLGRTRRPNQFEWPVVLRSRERSDAAPFARVGHLDRDTVMVKRFAASKLTGLLIDVRTLTELVDQRDSALSCWKIASSRAARAFCPVR